MMGAELDELLASPAYRRARHRVLRQLVEALLFERALPQMSWDGDTVIIPGRSANGDDVRYDCRAHRSVGFGRIRTTTPLMRQAAGQRSEATDPAEFLAEIAPSLLADEGRLAQFATDLLSTQIKDAVALNYRQPIILRDADYNTIDARLTDAHPYHPCYKSRVGFTLADSRRYSPETANAIRPVLLAARRDRCFLAIGNIAGGSVETSLLCAADAEQFEQALRRRSLRVEDYVPLPVHPWQWEEVILPLYHPSLARSELVSIGSLNANYWPQQSIRTLSNLSDVRAPNLKLSMNLVNTSTARGLSPHTVVNAPAISDWLSALVRCTDWRPPMAEPIVLHEFAGIGFTPSGNAAGQYGALACIWRQSIQSRLRPGESAAPMTALIHVDSDGRPFIDGWVRRYGAASWLQRLIERAWLPVLNLLWEHGIALESHAQNMILVHEEGWPSRVAVKDLAGGVRYCRQHLSAPPPPLVSPSAEHVRNRPAAFTEADTAEELRDYTFDALFFVNLAEVAPLLKRYYDLAETQFWQIVRDVLVQHQARHPQLRDRFSRFDCFACEIGIEQLASRRYLPEVRLRTGPAPNPLVSKVLT
jgi:siderophore synthetase component